MPCALVPKPRSRIYVARRSGDGWLLFWWHRGIENRGEQVFGPASLGMVFRFILESCKGKGNAEVDSQEDGMLRITATAPSWAHIGTVREACAESEESGQ